MGNFILITGMLVCAWIAGGHGHDTSVAIFLAAGAIIAAMPSEKKRPTPTEGEGRE